MKSRFVIQLHNADRAGKHYDIRIEKDGKLVSWASRNIPKIIDSNRKILLIKQPDHPLNWINFKGTIESGYGKGEVEIWDSGSVDILKFESNSINLIFYGNKIKGEYFITHPPLLSKDKYFMFKSSN